MLLEVEEYACAQMVIELDKGGVVKVPLDESKFPPVWLSYHYIVELDPVAVKVVVLPEQTVKLPVITGSFTTSTMQV